MPGTLSAHFSQCEPSAIRAAQIEFAKRQNPPEVINVAIGNVSLPMHPAMAERLRNLGQPGKPFGDGIVKYTQAVGTDEARSAFLNIIASSGFDTGGLYCQITDGGSQAMELCLIGTCGPAGSSERPLLLVDAAYTNYTAFAKRLGRKTVSIQRTLSEEGTFSLPSLEAIRQAMATHKPGAIVVIPYDNPTGHFYPQDVLIDLAKLCVEHDVWMISDEAYRELHYTGSSPSSVWCITEEQVPGISGRRISIETASKVWNACGLRIGGIVTDHPEFHQRSVAEYTANLCPNALGQHIFGALAHENHADLRAWYEKQRGYYAGMMQSFTQSMHEELPGVIVSSPDASLYSVVDVRRLVSNSFQAQAFVHACASEGSADLNGKPYT
ncbi:MAG: pyridoxal phosphate-dependent aminotransferase, partial [Candidatus Eisenbacteria bacterium]|nr:pyridoxal phosphate-dependent aminotransferase [Candidatus Eisenbacteria bacterium]